MNLSSVFSGRAVVLGLVAALAPAALVAADISASTAPYGVMSEPVARGTRGLAFPLIDGNRYVGIAAGNAADAIQLTSNSADPRPGLDTLGPSYVEVLSGPLEGERFDVDRAGTLAGDGTTLFVVLGGSGHSTRAALEPDVLTDARIAVRPHVTLAKLQATVTPALSGSNQAGRADAVSIFSSGRFVRYHLRGDQATWSRPGSSQDYRHLVIPPDASVLLETRSGRRTWTHAGVVRTNVFRKNLVAGEQPFASGFPVDLSPVEVGAFVDPEAPAATRWRGAWLFPFADWFEEHGVGVPLLHRYFLQPNGTSWRRVLDLRDVAHEPILGATSMFVLRRNQADPDYLIPVPFAVD